MLNFLKIENSIKNECLALKIDLCLLKIFYGIKLIIIDLL